MDVGSTGRFHFGDETECVRSCVVIHRLKRFPESSRTSGERYNVETVTAIETVNAKAKSVFRLIDFPWLSCRRFHTPGCVDYEDNIFFDYLFF